MTPPCFDRKPFTDPNAGWRLAGWEDLAGKLYPRPIYRYRWPWFVDRCATHDGRGVGPNGESFAVANGYECEGCRWLPEGLK